jgi:perosamine synthetase
MSKIFPLSQPFLSELETQMVSESIQSGWLTQSGEYVGAMEKIIHEHINAGDPKTTATTTSNGTTALHLVLMSIGIAPGDEVIVPDFGYIAPINAVLMCGATPVVVDVDEETWCINPKLVKNALTGKTKAVIAVDNYGIFADIQEIKRVIPESVFIIQDAAESFPSLRKNSNNLFDGDFVTMSFYANKIVTSAEGGAITGPLKYLEKINSLKNQSVKGKGTFEHIDIGFNYRISNLHAALFNAQWKRLPEILTRRTRIFEHYFHNFEKMQIEFRSNQFPIYTNPWLMTIRLKRLNKSVDQIRQLLMDKGIETRPGFKPASQHEYLRGRIKVPDSCEIAQKLHSEVMSLPTYPELMNDDIDFICSELKKALEG